LSRVGHASPIHVKVRFGYDGSDHTQTLAFAGDLIDRESARFADKGISIDQIEEFVDLLDRQVVREQDWRQTVESASCDSLAASYWNS
jgi:hypothetical protein